MFRRNVAGTVPRRLLDRLANRLVKIVTETRKLKTPEKCRRIDVADGDMIC